ncbi:MAG TPA: hypothetical protein VGG83_06110 [Trebonia sp.]|jgi:hypothetical protein
MATPDLAGLLRRQPTTTRPTPVPVPQERPLAVLRSEPTDRHETPPDTAPAPAKPERRIAPDTAATAPTRTTTKSTPRASQAPERRQYLQSITVYIPRSLHQQLHRTATDRATTATALMLAAINHTHDRLGEALTPQTEPADSGSLFDIPQVRAAAEPTVQTTIRITDRQLEAILTLSRAHDINRSLLIATALRLYLG